MNRLQGQQKQRLPSSRGPDAVMKMLLVQSAESGGTAQGRARTPLALTALKAKPFTGPKLLLQHHPRAGLPHPNQLCSLRG